MVRPKWKNQCSKRQRLSRRNNFNSFTTTTTTTTTMNMRTIFAAMNTTWVVVKLKPEKNSGLYGTWTGIVKVMGLNPAPYRPKFFRPYFYYCSLLRRSLSYSRLAFQIYDFHYYSFINHFTGLFRTNIMTSSQLAC